MKICELYDLTHSMAGDYLKTFEYPWEALSGLKAMISELGKTLSREEYDEIQPEIWVHKTAKIAPTASLNAPCIIGAETEVRPFAEARLSARAALSETRPS